MGAEIGTALRRAWWVGNDGKKGGSRKIWDIRGLGRGSGPFMESFKKKTFPVPKIFGNLGCWSGWKLLGFFGKGGIWRPVLFGNEGIWRLQLPLDHHSLALIQSQVHQSCAFSRKIRDKLPPTNGFIQENLKFSRENSWRGQGKGVASGGAAGNVFPGISHPVPAP